MFRLQQLPGLGGKHRELLAVLRQGSEFGAVQAHD
jgi:hypothetical protein